MDGLVRSPWMDFLRGVGGLKLKVKLSNVWRLGRVKDTKFDTDVSNEILLNAANCHGYSVSRF